MCPHLSVVQRAKLVALENQIAPAEYLLESEICLIGRADICQIIIPHKTVSRIQAIIEQDEIGHYILHDSNSANGTYVNGQRLQNVHILEDHDAIGFAAAAPLLRFEIVPPKAPPNINNAVSS